MPGGTECAPLTQRVGQALGLKASLDGIIAQLEVPAARRRSRLDGLGPSCSRPSRIVGVAEPELPDRLGGVDLSRRTAEKEAQQQPEMRAGPGVTGPA